MSHSIPIDKKNYPQYIKLGLNIAYYRKLAGFTQEQLAEACGISRTHISNIEALETLFNIARALHVSASKLLEFRD